MKYIYTKNGVASKVDDDICVMASKRKWFQNDKNQKRRNGYFRSGQGKNRIALHHFVIGKPQKGFIVDHINGDIYDNRRKNLRIVTLSESAINRRKFTGTKNVNKGVDFLKRKIRSYVYEYWRARIQVNKKSQNLGLFKTELEAIN